MKLIKILKGWRLKSLERKREDLIKTIAWLDYFYSSQPGYGKNRDKLVRKLESVETIIGRLNKKG